MHRRLMSYAMTPDDYLGPEAAARLDIDAMLSASGWVVQDFKKIALGRGPRRSRAGVPDGDRTRDG